MRTRSQAASLAPLKIPQANFSSAAYRRNSFTVTYLPARKSAKSTSEEVKNTKATITKLMAAISLIFLATIMIFYVNQSIEKSTVQERGLMVYKPLDLHSISAPVTIAQGNDIKTWLSKYLSQSFTYATQENPSRKICIGKGIKQVCDIRVFANCVSCNVTRFNLGSLDTPLSKKVDPHHCKTCASKIDKTVKKALVSHLGKEIVEGILRKPKG